MSTTLSAKELAARLETDPRTLRKFLRANARSHGAQTPGKGSRWSIEAREVRSLKKAFLAWDAARTVAASAEDEALMDA